MIIRKELNKVLKKTEKVIEEWVEETYDIIRNDTPEDTGNLQASWKMRRPSRLNYIVFTDRSSKDYADVIAAGRRIVNGKVYGSLQGWGKEGLWHLLEIRQKILERRLDV